ncbi:MAG: Fe2+-dependent dioxygenase [Gammaproteobacteria bacterium]|nr:Fe2+-dependent dioxygenase [Gammaproteobacteria bacterium]
MLTHIQGVLNAPQLGAACKLLDAGSFADGSRSAGMAAKRVKDNEELSLDDARHAELNNLVMGCLVKHPVYRSAAMPLKVATPYYARYTQGMSYGEHVDDPVMGEGQLYRSDISVTIFLNDPADYDGGELIITTAFGDQSIKLPAGDAILYPSSSLHRVSEVTRGERLVAVSWIQSMVRNAEQRTLLHELNQAREALLREQPDSDETRRVNHSYINLVRMWSEV